MRVGDECNKHENHHVIQSPLSPNPLPASGARGYIYFLIEMELELLGGDGGDRAGIRPVIAHGVVAGSLKKRVVVL